MDDSAEVVIIGAGIQGLSVASHLIKEGLKGEDIVLLERGTTLPHDKSETGRSAAMIMMQVHTLQNAKIRFSLASYPEYLSFKENFGTEVKFNRCGSVLYTIDPKNGADLKKSAQEQKELGIPSNVISPSELKDRVPFLYTNDIDTAIYCELDGYIDQLEAVEGYRTYLKKNRVNIFMKSDVEKIKVEKHRVVAVITQNQEIPTKRVVNAAGLFADKIGEMVGIQIPLEKKIRTLWHTSAQGKDIGKMPILEDINNEWYLRPDANEQIMIGVGPIFDVTGDLDNEDNFKTRHEEETNTYLSYRVPGLKGAKVGDGWSGIRDLSPDNLPILGPIEEVDGFINCCGFSGYGIMHAPISGQLIANYIARGESYFEFKNSDHPFRIDINEFLLSRFNNV
jgi:sarcosine oxidase subunit beta